MSENQHATKPKPRRRRRKPRASQALGESTIESTHQNISLSQILASLPFLTQYDRNIVSNVLVGLRGMRQQVSGEIRGQEQKKNSSGPTKGPAQKKSEHLSEPLYRSMKALEKPMKAFLKSNGTKLKDYDRGSASLPIEVSQYLEARQLWFLRLDEIKKDRESDQKKDPSD